MNDYERKIGNLSIQFLGGKDGIGGNLILLQFKDSKIVLDVGIQFSKLKSFYTWPLRTPTSVDELIDLGIAPKIDELYATWKKNGELDIKHQRKTNIDGVFISHYHLDHCYLLPQINRRIPIYMGETSKIFFDYYRKVKRREKGGIWRPDHLEENIKTFRTGDEINCGEFKVIPIHLDHSIPGAYAFIVECKDAIVAYTGDYRLHGPRKELTEDFIKACEERKVDLFITEGTNFFDVTSLTEDQVERELEKLIGRVKGSILASFGLKDIDRFNSYFKVAERTGNEILMSYRQLLILKELKSRDKKLSRIIPDLRSDIIKAYYKSIAKRLKKELESEGLSLICVRDRIGEDFLKGKIVTSFTEILQEISLVDIPPETIAVFSESEPVDEETQLEFEKIINWLKHIAVPSYRIHCSGHIYPSQLKEIVKRIKPKNLEVIHSEYPEVLKKYLLR